MDRLTGDGVYSRRLNRGDVVGAIADGARGTGTGDGNNLLAGMMLSTR